MKKIISIFTIIIIILNLAICPLVFASEFNSEFENTVISPIKTFNEVLKIDSINDIKYATIGYVGYPNDTYADVDIEDIKEFLSICWNLQYEVVIGPYNSTDRFYINIWTDEKYKFNSNYRCKQTIYTTNIVYGTYGKDMKNTGLAYSYNYVRYVPTKDSLSIIAEAAENLMDKYDDKTRVANNNDGILVPSTTPNYFVTGGCSQWAEADLQRAAAKNLVPYELANYYTDGISREDFCELATQLIAVLYKASSYDTVNSKEIQSVAEEIINNKNLDSAFENISYKDVEIISDEIRFLSALGIVYGTGEDSFEPNSYITREEASTILSRIATFFELEMSCESSNYSDDFEISEWAQTSVYQMKNRAVMHGDENNFFNPKQIYTKEQSIITIYRLYSIIFKDIHNII